MRDCAARGHEVGQPGQPDTRSYRAARIRARCAPPRRRQARRLLQRDRADPPEQDTPPRRALAARRSRDVRPDAWQVRPPRLAALGRAGREAHGAGAVRHALLARRVGVHDKPDGRRGAARSAPRHRVGLRPLLRAALCAGRRRAGARAIAARVALRISRRIVHALPPRRAGRAAVQGDAGLGEAAAQPFVRPVRPLPQPGPGEAARKAGGPRYGRHMHMHMRCVSRCRNELTHMFGPKCRADTLNP
mmetsp:Transcript_13622/g.43583  ORF Transcript_13622/g.43583 Transcript_13622/m.43583 type:complete len:247 (+) Transcript_13622:308-1048(+)